MAVRRVYVIWTNPLFHESARLLLKHPNIIIVGAAGDFTTAHEDIMRLQPDTILFEKTRGDVPIDVMEILEAETWDMRIIGTSLDNNEMSLYHREHQMVGDAGDLLQFILG
ncbi:MAG: hypothetical protein ACM3H7_04835 [Acidobacteriaceae bacterium]